MCNININHYMIPEKNDGTFDIDFFSVSLLYLVPELTILNNTD